MKLTTFLLCVSLGCAFAGKTYSQSKLLSLNLEGTTVKEALTQIEDQSEFYFMYSSKLIDVDREVTLNLENKKIDRVLSKLFVGTDVNYVIKDRFIVLTTEDVGGNIVSVIQQKTISGKVTDEEGQSLPGVNIIVKGTSIGSVSDVEGNYSLEVPGEESVLVFSSVGYLREEITVGTKSIIDISLVPDITALEEIVVIGYGTARRKDISGAVGTLKLEESPIANSPNTNILQSLKGSMAGLNISEQTSPGETPGILVRGQNSIKGSNDPLIVLDGIIYFGSFADINPDDIAVIDVLKDASAAAVYGSRAANGVIVITTKEGKSDKPDITYNMYMGINNWPNPPDLMNRDRWAEKYVAQNPSLNSPDEIVHDGAFANSLWQQGNVDTDWVDLVSRNGFIQNHQVAVSGRGNRLNYYFSGGYSDHKGIVVGDDFKRISVRSRLNADITDWLEVGLDGAYNNNDYSGIGANMGAVYGQHPWGYPYRYDGMPLNPGANTSRLLEKFPTGQSVQNPLWGTDGTIDDVDKSHFYRLATYALIKVPKVDGLTYRFNYSINSNLDIQDRFYYETHGVGEAVAEPYIDRYSPAELQKLLSGANGYNNRTNRYSYVMDNIINYKRELGDHYVDVTAVATRDYSYSKLLSAIGRDFSVNGNTLLGVDGIHKAAVQNVDINVIERANVGYLGRIAYAYKDKYHVTASMRRDGASVFGEDQKWGNFPSVGVAWTVSEEGFMSNMDKLNYLKVKFSYGKNGNQGLIPYQTLARVNSGNDGGIRYEFGDAPQTILYGISQANLGSPNLGWETTTAFNGGFQSAWLNNRVFLDLDFYFSETTDQIFERQIPIMTGFESIFSSLGQVNNNGIEISLRTVNIDNSNLKWSSGLIFWRNRNKIESLYGDDLDGDGKEDDDIANSLFVGKPIDAIYGYEYIGVVQEDDAEYIANVGALPGDPMFRDISGPNGTPDGIITADHDRKILGYRQENFRLSLSNTVEYKNFSLYVMLTGIFGGGKDNYFMSENPRHNSFSGRFDTNEIDHDWWTPENKSNTYLRPDYVPDNRYLGLQSRGFVKIQDVNLSYRLPKGVFKSIGLNSLEVYANIRNLYTFTDWFGGGDPEAGIRADFQSYGHDVERYPVPRTFSAGLKVSF
ncbi:MAG: TonB-dependent receptor [Cytophagales bacterium]|nr:TonB-dependent receptor [Cytophagales bacterium]